MFPDIYIVIFWFADSSTLRTLCCVNLEFYQLIHHHLKTFPKKYQMFQMLQKMKMILPQNCEKIENFSERSNDSPWSQVKRTINLTDTHGYILELKSREICFVFLGCVVVLKPDLLHWDTLYYLFDWKNQRLLFSSYVKNEVFQICLSSMKLITKQRLIIDYETIKVKDLARLVKEGSKLLLEDFENDDRFSLRWMNDDGTLSGYHIPCPLRSGAYGTQRRQLSDNLILFLDGRKAFVYRQIILNLYTSEKKMIKPHGLFDNECWNIRCISYGNKYFVGWVNFWYQLKERKDCWFAEKIDGVGEYPVYCPNDGIFFIKKSNVNYLITT